MRFLFRRIARLVSTIVLRHGLFGGNKFLTSFAAVILSYRVLQKVTGTGPRKLYSHKLQDGESLVITNRPVR